MLNPVQFKYVSCTSSSPGKEKELVFVYAIFIFITLWPRALDKVGPEETQV